jgi:beta-1,2-mannobiose phosphorylase / 1,2-beta-oligomannan phosphorylase
VVFSCANFRRGDDLIVPYAGADSRIFGARLSFSDLQDALEAIETA